MVDQNIKDARNYIQDLYRAGKYAGLENSTWKGQTKFLPPEAFTRQLAAKFAFANLLSLLSPQNSITELVQRHLSKA